MSDHWTERNKHKAKSAFNESNDNALDLNRVAEHPKPPQPQLTPKGPMRDAVDRQVSRDVAAQRALIEKRKEEIQRKFAYDREVARAQQR